MSIIVKTLTRTVTVLLLVGLAAVAAVMAVVPMMAGWETRAVLTQSMAAGGMPAGSLIALEDVPTEDIRVGDVIAYRQQDGSQIPITHRVIDVATNVEHPDQPAWVLKGDSNQVPDPQPVTGAQLVGRLVVVDLPILGRTAYIVPFLGAVVTMPVTVKAAVFAAVAAVFVGLPLLTRAVTALVRRARRAHATTATAASQGPATASQESER